MDLVCKKKIDYFLYVPLHLSFIKVKFYTVYEIRKIFLLHGNVLNHFLKKRSIFFLLIYHAVFKKVTLHPWNWYQVYHNDEILWSPAMLDHFFSIIIDFLHQHSCKRFCSVHWLDFLFSRITIFTSFVIMEL